VAEKTVEDDGSVELLPKQSEERGEALVKTMRREVNHETELSLDDILRKLGVPGTEGAASDAKDEKAAEDSADDGDVDFSFGSAITRLVGTAPAATTRPVGAASKMATTPTKPVTAMRVAVVPPAAPSQSGPHKAPQAGGPPMDDGEVARKGPKPSPNKGRLRPVADVSDKREAERGVLERERDELKAEAQHALQFQERGRAPLALDGLPGQGGEPGAGGRVCRPAYSAAQAGVPSQAALRK
jgi:hypothetical protein